MFNKLEVCASNILLVKCFKIRFVSVYRPPGIKIELTSFLCDCLVRLASVAYDVSVVGDFNCGDVDWSHNLYVGSTAGSLVKNWSISCSLRQYCVLPTSNEKTPYCIFVSENAVISDVDNMCPFSTSDYAITQFKYTFPI